MGKTTELRVKCWEDFEEEVAKLEQPGRPRWDELWFRGQGNASWGLQTTLERRVGVGRSVGDYFRLINRIKPAIETFTGAAFETPDRSSIDQSIRSYDLFHQFIFSSATYLAHLRHNGFPSPLLDWSGSPYVAAYFAFSRSVGTDIAIYVFRERPHNMKLGGSDTPSIFSLGPIIKTHKRHFRQQSRYTICAQFEEQKEWMFVPHDSGFGTRDREQDFLWKFVMPASERRKVLRHFDKFNLNEFTLFDTEEGLMEMLAMREFDLSEPST
ncbi:MAG: FRG domain-containing protein [Xanthobacteraceae bacterium]